MSLYHVSDNGTVEVFEPRDPPSPDAGVHDPSVWGVDDRHLVNYLLPRNCPRVTFYPVKESAKKDVNRLIGPSESSHVIVIEADWLERAWNCSLWVYAFSEEGFYCVDSGAGYFVTHQAVRPIRKTRIEYPILELVRRGVELRVVPSLWPIRDAVIESTLQFSCIRMRNAKARLAEPAGRGND